MNNENNVLTSFPLNREKNYKYGEKSKNENEKGIYKGGKYTVYPR